MVHGPRRFALADALSRVGRTKDARSIYEGLLASRPGSAPFDTRERADSMIGPAEGMVGLAEIAALLGRPDEVARIAGLLESVDPSPSRRLQQGRSLCIALGDLDAAMEVVHGYLAAGDYWWSLHAQSYLEPLWDYPPFQELIRPRG